MTRSTARLKRLASATLVIPSAERTLPLASKSPSLSASTAQRYTTPVASCARRRPPPLPTHNGMCLSLTATCTSFVTTVSSPFLSWAPTALPPLLARHSECPAISRLAPLSLSAGFPRQRPAPLPTFTFSPPPEPSNLARLAEVDVRNSRTNRHCYE